MKKTKVYVIVGTVLMIVSLVGLIVFLFLPTAVKEGNTTVNIISLVCVIILFLVFLVGVYLFKKGKYLKLNADLKVSEDLFKKELEEKIKEKQEEARKNNEN